MLEVGIQIGVDVSIFQRRASSEAYEMSGNLPAACTVRESCRWLQPRGRWVLTCARVLPSGSEHLVVLSKVSK